MAVDAHIEAWRLKMEPVWSVDQRSHFRISWARILIRIKVESRIQIRIKVNSRIQVRIKVNSRIGIHINVKGGIQSERRDPK
jgi:hypothetical protein